jgi:bromodomain-containing protein 7/9
VTKFTCSFPLNQVGLHVKHSYARSLAHFAADLGPVAWKFAARKISSILPPGHEFGPGWVSDDDVSQKQHFTVRDERNSDPPVPEDYRSRFPSPSKTFSLANTSCLQSGDAVINRDSSYQNEMNPGSSVSGGNESMIHSRIQQEPMAHSDDFSSNGRLRSNFSPQMTMVRLADLTGSSNAGNAPQMVDMDTINSLSGQIAPTNINPTGLKAQFFNKSSQSDSSNLSAPESGFDPQRFSQGLAGKSSWQGLEVPTKQNSFSPGNDLNGLMGATNSHSSNVETGPQLQPNLALQL